MTLFVWLTLLCFLLVLKPTQAFNSTTDALGTKSFHSSLQQSYRRFSCPGESVVYSCTTYGRDLVWKVNDDILKTFSMMDPEGAGFSCDDEACPFNHPCFLFSAVLDDIVNSTRNGRNYTYCYSTLTVTPGRLNNETSVLGQCDLYPDQQSLNISCEVLERNAVHMAPLAFAVAGVPNVPAYNTWQCLQKRSGDSVMVQLRASSSNSTDLDYNVVELYNPNNQNLKAMKVSATGDNTICFRITPNWGISNIYVNVTAFDRCNQNSFKPSTKYCYPAPTPATCTFYPTLSRVEVNISGIRGNNTMIIPDYYMVKVHSTMNNIAQKMFVVPENRTDPLLFKDIQEQSAEMIVVNVTTFYTCWQDTYKINCKSGAMLAQPQLEWLYYFLLVCGSSTDLWM